VRQDNSVPYRFDGMGPTNSQELSVLADSRGTFGPERPDGNHCSSIARKRLGREYSVQPSCMVSPKGPKIGIDSGPFAMKHL
jgi:hypothetical protein